MLNTRRKKPINKICLEDELKIILCLQISNPQKGNISEYRQYMLIYKNNYIYLYTNKFY